MEKQDILIEEGMNLLYSGMIVVFSFLVLLIISVNILRIFFSALTQNNKVEESFNPLVEQNNIHHKIIKEVLGGIKS